MNPIFKHGFMRTDRRTLFLIVVLSCLLAIWPLPNTIAIRQLLLVSGAFVAITVIHQYYSLIFIRSNWNLWLFLSFFGWLLFHYFALSTNGEEQLYDLKGDWARALLATITGLAAGLLLARSACIKGHRFLEGVFVLGLSGTVVIYVGRYAREVLETGQLVHQNFYMEPYLGKTPLVVFGSVFLCALFARLSTELATEEKIRWYSLAALSIVLVGLTYYFSNTKNGFIVFIFIFIIYVYRIIRNHMHFKAADKVIAIFIFLALASFVKTHIDANPSWLNFYADVKAGHDIENNKYWKDAEKYQLPLNDRGVTANGSTYERSAWATAGIILVKEHPLGYGLINHSFGALALEKWTDFYKPIGKYRHASHSGWLDFTLGFGIPGLVMILLPMWVCFYRANKREEFWFEFVRWSVPVVTLVYTITEVCTGHFIEFLFFYIALISGITIKKSMT